MADSELTSEAEDMSDSEYMTCDEGNRDSMDQQGRTQAPTTAQDQARPESPSLAQDLATAQCTAASAVSDQGAPTGGDEGNRGSPITAYLPDVPQHPIVDDGPPTYDESQASISLTGQRRQHEGFPSTDQQGRTQAPTTAQDQARPESPSLAQDLATAQCTAASAVSDQGAPTGDGIEDTTPLENILDNEDLLSKIAVMLDQDSNSRKNWKAIATKYGIGYNERKNIEYVNCQNGRCTEVVLGKVVSSNPDITVRDFLVKLEEIGRNDVIDVVKKFYHE